MLKYLKYAIVKICTFIQSILRFEQNISIRHYIDIVLTCTCKKFSVTLDKSLKIYIFR